MTRKQYAAKFTPEQRAAYKEAQRKEATETLEAAVESLQTSEGFRAWLTAPGPSSTHTHSITHYSSIGKRWLPHATRVASAKVWNDLDRHVVKGEKSLKVFAPIEWWVKVIEASAPGARWNEKKAQWEKKARSFKLVPVFDVSQTDGEALPPNLAW